MQWLSGNWEKPVRIEKMYKFRQKWWKNDADFRTIEMYGNLRHFVYRKRICCFMDFKYADQEEQLKRANRFFGIRISYFLRNLNDHYVGMLFRRHPL